MRIVFTRLSDDAVVGEIVERGGGLTARGGAVELLEMAQARGERNKDILRKYSSWSNGVFVSREA